jgi:hypothetical protein
LTKAEKETYYRHMDPKSAQTLDPKLKEAYDRVMGATLPTSQTPPVANPSVGNSPVSPHHDPLDKMAIKENPPMQAAAPLPTHQAGTVSPSPTPVATAPLHVSSGFVAPHEEKKAPVSGTLLIVAGVVFLIVYTLFWLKWFGIPLPFLP